MTEALSKTGLFFDELNKVRVLEPEVSHETNKLKEECQDFEQRITEFQKITDVFVEMLDNLAKLVEKEKMKAIGGRNLLKSMAKQREAQQQQLQALVIEKSFELERLRVQHQSLQRVEQEQQELIEHLILR